jgi:hypothetical protein
MGNVFSDEPLGILGSNQGAGSAAVDDDLGGSMG